MDQPRLERKIQLLFILGLILVEICFEEKEASREERKEKEIVLVFVGDNLLAGRMENYYLRQFGEDFPYQKVSPILQEADLAFGNLENPLTNSNQLTPAKSLESIKAGKNFVFKSSPNQSTRILKKAGFDILSLANNHLMDYQAEGLFETIEALKEAGIDFVGAGNNIKTATTPKIFEVEGVKIAFFAASMIKYPYFCAGKNRAGIFCFEENMLYHLIEEYKAKVDFIVISLHWGKEGEYFPQQFQRQLAWKIIEAGADIIIGHHPHRLQGLEVYQGKIIAYSLGNFMFCGKSKNLESAILRIRIHSKKIVKIELLPLFIADCQPQPTNNKKVINKILKINQPLGTNFQLQDSVLVLVTP